jgi:hypothetical protein
MSLVHCARHVSGADRKTITTGRTNETTYRRMFVMLRILCGHYDNKWLFRVAAFRSLRWSENVAWEAKY